MESGDIVEIRIKNNERATFIRIVESDLGDCVEVRLANGELDYYFEHHLKKVE